MGELYSAFPDIRTMESLLEKTGLNEHMLRKELIHLVMSGEVQIPGMDPRELDHLTATIGLTLPQTASKFMFVLSPQARAAHEAIQSGSKVNAAAKGEARFRMVKPNAGRSNGLLDETTRHLIMANEVQVIDPPTSAAASQIAIELAAKAILAAEGYEMEEHDVSIALHDLGQKLRGDDSTVERRRRSVPWRRTPADLAANYHSTVSGQ